MFGYFACNSQGLIGFQKQAKFQGDKSVNELVKIIVN